MKIESWISDTISPISLGKDETQSQYSTWSSKQLAATGKTHLSPGFIDDHCHSISKIKATAVW